MSTLRHKSTVTDRPVSPFATLSTEGDGKSLIKLAYVHIAELHKPDCDDQQNSTKINKNNNKRILGLNDVQNGS